MNITANAIECDVEGYGELAVDPTVDVDHDLLALRCKKTGKLFVIRRDTLDAQPATGIHAKVAQSA